LSARSLRRYPSWRKLLPSQRNDHIDRSCLTKRHDRAWTRVANSCSSFSGHRAERGRSPGSLRSRAARASRATRSLTGRFGCVIRLPLPWPPKGEPRRTPRRLSEVPRSAGQSGAQRRDAARRSLGVLVPRPTIDNP
jgi:hypothetical protein